MASHREKYDLYLNYGLQEFREHFLRDVAKFVLDAGFKIAIKNQEKWGEPITENVLEYIEERRAPFQEGVAKFGMTSVEQKTGDSICIDIVDQSKRTLSLLSSKTCYNLSTNQDILDHMLAALSLTFKDDNRLKHIILCCGIKESDIEFRLRWFNPVIVLDSESKWKDELRSYLDEESRHPLSVDHINIGHGLAWSHYNGFLRLFEGDVNPFSGWKSSATEEFFDIFVVLVPKSCKCAAKDIPDPAIKFDRRSPTICYERAGKSRKATLNIYRISWENKEYFVPIQYAASVETIHYLNSEEMTRNSGIVRLSDSRKNDERERYETTLKEIIRDKVEHGNNAKWILIHSFDDSKVGGEGSLAEPLLEELKVISERNKWLPLERKRREKPFKVRLLHGNDEEDGGEQDIVTSGLMRAAEERRICLELTPVAHGSSTTKGGYVCNVVICTNSYPTKSTLEQQVHDSYLNRYIFLYKDNETFPLQRRRDTEKMNVKLLKREDMWEQAIIDAIIAFPAPHLEGQVRFQNIAEGLAWNYYTNYLLLCCEGLTQRIIDCRNSSSTSGFEMSHKLFILLPSSGRVHSSLTDEDSNIVKKTGLEVKPVKKDVACQTRIYTPTLYKMMEEEKEYVVVAEYLTPLNAIAEIHQEYFADLSAEQSKREMIKLMEIVQVIREDNLLPELQDKIVFVSYDDETGQLFDTLLSCVKDELATEAQEE